jgi:hypothetical protein
VRAGEPSRLTAIGRVVLVAVVLACAGCSVPRRAGPFQDLIPGAVDPSLLGQRLSRPRRGHRLSSLPHGTLCEEPIKFAVPYAA